MRILSSVLWLAVAAASSAAQNSLGSVLDLRDDVTTRPAADTRRVAFVDYDADGDQDLFHLNYDEPNHIFRNTGGGVFEVDTALNALTANTPAKGVAFGDMDADGDLDAFIANGNDRPNTLLRNLSLNEGGGSPGLFAFVTGGEITTIPNHSYGAAWGDLNGDDKLDLVVANRYQPDEVWFGNGDGTFVRDAGSALAANLLGSRDVANADLDLDGDLDVVIVNSTGAHDEVWKNRGGAEEGVFDLLAGDPTTSSGGSTYGLAVGDLNADGLPEIVMGNRDTPNFLFANVTDGGVLAFERITSGPFDPSAEAGDVGDTYGIALGDVDGNGHVDVLMANRTKANFLYLATGEAEFDYHKATAGQFVKDRGDARGVALADLDGDGLPEVALANTFNTKNRLFDNLGPIFQDQGFALAGTNGLASLCGEGTMVPRTKAILRVENGPALAPAFLLVSMDLGLTPFGGGVLVPDMSTGLVEGMFLTDSFGQLELQAKLPADLVTGFVLFLQIALVDGGAPAGVALTNGLLARTQ